MKFKYRYWMLLKPFVRKYLQKHFAKKSIRIIFRNAKAEYRRLLSIADDIGANNPMASNLYFSLLFVSFLTGNKDLFTEDMLAEMIEEILNSPILKNLSKADLNNEKDMEKFKNRMFRCSEWAERHRDRYPETWAFHFKDKHRDGFYYHFTKCPIAKFFRDNNMEHLTHLFCATDHMSFRLRKGRLIREYTLANGDDICDFWVVGDRVENPE